MTISNEQIQALKVSERDTLALNGNEISNQLRHLADNEIDSDSFAVVTENYNGREVEFERPITDLAIDAAEMMDKLLAAHEADKALIEQLRIHNRILAGDGIVKQDRIAELERQNNVLADGVNLFERKLLEARTLTSAATDVLVERQRQITSEGWTPEHDDEHVEGQLSDAAACYALFATDQRRPVPAYWPWSDNWWKQRGQRRDLVMAGALIIAEIERLDRSAGITLKVGGED